MSQILRLTRNWRAKILSLHGSTMAFDSALICKGCQMLRTEFSTNAKAKPQSMFFKKKKWKKRENLYKKLTQSLDARLVQLSASPGNQFLSQRGDQSLYLLGNKTSKDGRVEQNVYYVGNSFNTEEIALLEKEIELLRGKVPHEKNVTSEFSHRCKVRLKDLAEKSVTSTVIDKTNKELEAISVINDKAKGYVDNTSSDFVESRVKVSESPILSHVSVGNFKHKTDVDGAHPLFLQNVTDSNSSVIPFQEYNCPITDLWAEKQDKEHLSGGENIGLSKDKPRVAAVPKRKKKLQPKRKKTAESKVVSKPPHVKSVNISKTPAVENSIDHVKPNIKIDADVDKDSFTDMDNEVDIEDLTSVKAVSGTKAKHKKKIKGKTKLENKRKSAEELEKAVLESFITIFNRDFRSFVEACCCVGLHDHALSCLHYYRRLNKAGYQKYSVRDVEIYNSILKCLAEKGDLKSIQELQAVMNEDSVQPDLQTYAMSLYCLSQNLDHDPIIAQYMITDMEREGLCVNDIFRKLSFIGKERDAVLKVVQQLNPDFEIPAMDDRSTYKGPLVEQLNNPLHISEMVEPNPYAGVTTAAEVMKKADIQFRRELDGYMRVKSIAPRLSHDSTTDRKHKKQPKVSKEKLEQLKKEWRLEITKAFREKMQKMEKKFNANNSMSMYPFFKLLPEQVYIDMLMKEIELLGSYGEFYSPPSSTLYRQFAQKICDRYHVQYMADNKIIPKVKNIYKKYTEAILDPNTESINHRNCWMTIQNDIADGKSLEVEEKLWSPFLKKALGKELYEIILSKVKVPTKGPGGQMKKVPAFLNVIRQKELNIEEEIKPHPQFLKLMSAQEDIVFAVGDVPMIIPPLPWVSPSQGCNFFGTSKTIRWHLGKQMTMFKETEDAGPILDSLNILGACPWKVNKPVLDVIIKVFNSGGNDFLDIPILPSKIAKPPKRKGNLPKTEKVKAYKEKMAYDKQVNEATSLWYSSLYKFSIANQFRDEIFWFPHNMDFRGRTYALPPHFNQLGGDTARAIIKFAKGKPLGPNGLDWLKIHLVNLTGLKKKCSLKDRLEFANEMMDEILDSADNPLEGRRWWSFSDEPWQTLACCMEIANASRSDDPAKFVSSYPVHQDGSCNGLQHYAAMGRDTAGAKSVNLFPFETPSDVYQDVVDLVEKKRQRDLLEGDNGIKKAAQICEGHVERKVIKQTIMTTVYGVTKYGARLQIARQLKERGMPNDQVIIARRYLADSTFFCLQQMFSSAKKIQDWFNACATSICGIGQRPVQWVTPLNFPVIQPYFQQLQAKSYGVSITSRIMENQHPSVVKQKNAFAPNYVHSLDSTHMMLTSLYCLRAGITFVSVHDCFWTHPCDVEVMNKITREQFISLHKQPILENLSKYFVKTFCDTEQDITASDAGNQSAQSYQSDLPLSESDQSNNALLLDAAQRYQSDLSLSESDQSNSALQSKSATNQSEDIDISVLDISSPFNETNQLDTATNLDMIESCHSSESEISHFDSDLSQIESSQSDVAATEIESSSATMVGEQERNKTRTVTDVQRKRQLKKVLTSVPGKGDFDLELVAKSTYFFS